ncbi:hypothetical protein OEZ86_002096 [Tetradesmus obliquus]|nr:hypothetical protein OEZ86_002096 [Tetradesmus obliquus]
MTWLLSAARLPASQTFPIETQGPTFRQRGMADALPGVFFETTATHVQCRQWQPANLQLMPATQTPEKLKCKDMVLSAIAEGTSVIFGFMGLLRSDAPQARLLELELGIQLLQQQADAAGGFLQGPNATVDEIMALGLAAADGPAEEQFSTKLIREWFQPAWVAQVLSMSDAGIAARLKQLVGESAVLMTQLRLTKSAYKGASNNLVNVAWLERSASLGRLAVNGMQLQRAASVDTDGSSRNNRAEAPAADVPAVDAAAPMVEYAAILTTLMLWDEGRYGRIQNMNLDTLEPADSAPQQLWTRIADNLDLTKDQAGLLYCCQDRNDAMTQPLIEGINEAAADGLRNAQLQEKEQQQKSALVLPQRQPLLSEQARVQQRYEMLLAQWQLLEVQLNMVTLNTLSMQQLGRLQVLSYPRCPRIDCVIRGCVRPDV